MARRRIVLVFALAIAAGLVFAVATYKYVKRAPATKVASMPTRPVVVAASDLEVGAEIGEKDVRVIDWPAGAVPSAAIADPHQVIGRGLVLPMIQNEPFIELKLASRDAGAGLPPAIPPGLRAVSVRVNEVIGVAGYVLPGTRVDVVATVNPTQQSSDTTSKVILTNVEVLAAGTKLDREADRNKPIPVSVVTLLVDPDEAERLTLASTEGKIQLALRNPLDKTTPATHGVRAIALLGTPASTPPRPPIRLPAAAPVKSEATPRPEPLSVEVIRGDKRVRELVGQE